MFFVLSKILDVLLSPFTWGVVLVALAVPWRRPRRTQRWRPRRAVGVTGLVVLLTFSLEPVSNRLMHRLERAVPPTYRPDVVYDAVVLLGGVSDERVVWETGEPAYNENVERLVVTHRLLRDGRANVAIVSGAAMNPALAEVAEARVLAEQLVDWGIEPARVIVEDRARNTYENAAYTKEIVAERGFTRVLVVTSAFHMRRAVECFSAVGMAIDVLPVDYRAHSDKSPGRDSLLPRAGYLSESARALREMAGLHIYRLKGYAKPARD